MSDTTKRILIALCGIIPVAWDLLDGSGIAAAAWELFWSIPFFLVAYFYPSFKAKAEAGTEAGEGREES